MPYDNWFVDFVGQEDSLIRAKEPYTMELNKKWDDIMVDSFPHQYNYLDTADINELFEYIREYP
ncbi:MAG: hypothetical protein SchgKO_10870 [Schleiferiaceae bacterium]